MIPAPWMEHAGCVIFPPRSTILGQDVAAGMVDPGAKMTQPGCCTSAARFRKQAEDNGQHIIESVFLHTGALGWRPTIEKTDGGHSKVIPEMHDLASAREPHSKVCTRTTPSKRDFIRKQQRHQTPSTNGVVRLKIMIYQISQPEKYICKGNAAQRAVSSGEKVLRQSRALKKVIPHRRNSI